MPFVYAFEAKSIQRYITETGRLRDLAGGSLLVDALAAPADARGHSADLVEAVLAQMEHPHLTFVRRAGGAFALVSDDKGELETFRALYTLAVQGFAPQLAFADGIASGETLGAALKAVVASQTASRACIRPSLPEIGPLTALAPRTGRAAVAIVHDERIDLASSARRSAIAFQKSARDRGELAGIEHRMMPPARRVTCVWPNELDAADAMPGAIVMPGLGENSTVGLLHADGNGLGQLLISIRSKLEPVTDTASVANFLMTLSREIAAATERAIHVAVEEVLVHEAIGDPDAIGEDHRLVLAARPIVMGGDDVTMLLRGDLAMPFCRRFLLAFETETAVAMTNTTKTVPKGLQIELPQKLTACAGIAYVNASQPFDRASDLAEQLCASAKQISKSDAGRFKMAEVMSSVSFHRVTTSRFAEYASIRDGELRVVSDRGSEHDLYMTMGAYRLSDVGPADQFMKPLDSLIKLASLLGEDRFPDGPLRQYLGVLSDQPLDAGDTYKRWRKVMQSRGHKSEGGMLTQFDVALAELGVVTPETAPIVANDPQRPSSGQRTPLLDAYSLKMAARRLNKNLDAAS
ncbi:hypothetical protein [Rhabdaerophilum sp. SD176]|uniref:Cas10/Cmr2 second palm domain-containing protein n=1 Tax=Rhabdaerophilum sp. SD176 TaxID=2983548 RepID=UPI0024DF5F32|nr:hypothetical protein [Rhabdaerophilum sp. SD176]